MAESTAPPKTPAALRHHRPVTIRDFHQAYDQLVAEYKALPPQERDQLPNPTKAGREYVAWGFELCLRVYFGKSRKRRPPPDPARPEDEHNPPPPVGSLEESE